LIFLIMFEDKNSTNYLIKMTKNMLKKSEESSEYADEDLFTKREEISSIN
jgi:hypothetical protein